ncbi:engulfment and cell motility elm family protein [Stylonychia lemnae]|uniref:Engulfment and cell motility elm family protein n=1 Tax=Stylonychia lemnae TaxID=5949 RepID=A0A078APG4_STYLE|nr:engulfment and cell motility elm family protein [Stylonychia lemnae]|eukprot:CDW82828.1 engulfment and cell motility elm family protein [Stylonychia lemnae]
MKSEEYHSDPFQWSEDDEEVEHEQLLNDYRRKQQVPINAGDLESNDKRQMKKIHSLSKKYDLNRQPIFHQQNKGAGEKLCCCIVQNQDLNRREIRKYYQFSEDLVQFYDEKNSQHEAHLKQYYLDNFRTYDRGQNIPDNLISDEWTKIGFQGKNPRTDFRGGGILGLQSLRYFTQNYNEIYQEMINDKTETFFTAITGINIAHSILTYLYMNKNEVANQVKKLRAGRKQFKTFAKLNARSKQTFFELHAFVFIRTFQHWKVEYEKSKPRMPNFYEVQDLAKKEMHDLLSNTELNDVKSVIKRNNQIASEKYK